MSDLLPVRQAAFSLAPRTLNEAMEFAKMMANSELVPKAFRGKPGDVLIAVQMGAEVGLAPMAAIQNIAVINGKPGIYGDAGKAILLANGCQIEEDDIEVVKKTGRARCKVTRKGRVPVERTFSIENAKVARLWGKEGPWTNYPERQLAWRAFWFAARDAASDLLKGLAGAEELSDIEPSVEAVAVPAIRPPQRKSEALPADATPQPTAPEADDEATTPITEDQRVAFYAAAKRAGFKSKEAVQEWLVATTGIEDSAHITTRDYDDVLAAVSEGPRS